jgi:DNA replication and repair protein RecF
MRNMHVAFLLLTNFRNHADARIEAAPGFVVLSGANGAGKTNILEALSLLTPGRGLRAVPFVDMAQAGGGNGFAVAARLMAEGQGAALPDVTIGTAISAVQPGKRIVQVNGAAASASRLSEWLSVVWLTPAMDRIFTDTASGRRRFLDRLVLALEPAHASHATRYEAAMRARTKLLTGDMPPDPVWLSALEAQMGEHGAAIDAARHRMVDALSAHLAAADADFLATPTLLLAGENQPDALWDADALAGALHSARARDAAAGRALTGPHRADLVAVHKDKGVAAAHSSTGEQKAMLIRILLAHAALVKQTSGGQRGLILLLDEVAAHLDPDRRAALYTRLAETGAQVWVTGTDAGLFDALPSDATRYHLDSAGIQRIS